MDEKIHGLMESALGKLGNPPTLSWKQPNDMYCDHFETALKSMYENEAGHASDENIKGAASYSYFGRIIEEINQDAMPRLRMLRRSLDDLVKSLCAAGPSAAAESAAVARAFSEIQRQIPYVDAPIQDAAYRHVSALARDLLTSPAAAAAPDNLVFHLAQDLACDLANGSDDAVKEAARVLAASPSAAFPVLFKPLAACLSSPDASAFTAAAVAFCELSAPPADAAPFLPFAPDLCSLLTTSRSDVALINALCVLARLACLESSHAAQIADPLCQLLARSSSMYVIMHCIRRVLAVLPAHHAAASLAIRKVKEFLAAAHDPNLGLLAFGIFTPGYASIVDMCHNVIALSLGDADSNIRREALHLLMGMVDGDNVMGIVGMLVSHAAKSDPEFANEILGVVLEACGRNVYELVMNFGWYVSLLSDMSRSLHCAQGDEIGRQLVDVGLRVEDARRVLVHAARTLLIDPALLGNHLLCPILSAAAWVSGEYVVFTKDLVQLVEALLQPRTSLLPMSVRAVYIQAVHKVITFCCNLYLERLTDSNKELDVVFNGLAIAVRRENEAPVGSGEEQIVEESVSQKSIFYMIDLIETRVGPLLDCNELDSLERARNLINFVHLMKQTQEVSDDDQHRRAKELVKNMQVVFSQESSPVFVNAHSHPTSISMTSSGRSGHCQGKHKQRERSSTLPDAPCSFETKIRQPYISAGTLSYFGDAERFEAAFKMKRTFDYICGLVNPVEDISSYTLLDGTVLLLEDQVALALRMFMPGGPMGTVLSDVGVSRSTFGLIFWKFVDAMLKQENRHLCWPDSIKMESIKSKFEVIHGMPNCCGVVDTTYITTTPSAETNCDHEKNHSIAVQTVLDPDTRITDVLVEWTGSKNQSSILHSSDLFKACEKGFALNGSKLKVSDGLEVGEYLIGDAAYPLLPWLLTPYQEKDLSDPKVEFNRRHSAARTITQRVLARLKDTWKWMHGGGSWGYCPAELLHDLVKIIKVSCLLHNIVIEMEGAEEHIPSNHDMNFMQQACELADENAVRLRDILSQYLTNRTLKFGGTLSMTVSLAVTEDLNKCKARKHRARTKRAKESAGKVKEEGMHSGKLGGNDEAGNFVPDTSALFTFTATRHELDAIHSDPEAPRVSLDDANTANRNERVRKHYIRAKGALPVRD